MTIIHGVVAFHIGAGGESEFDAVGRGLLGAGVDAPRRWRDGAGSFAVAQSRFTPEDRWERQPAQDGAGCVTLIEGYLFDRAGVQRELGLPDGMPDSALAGAFISRFGPERLKALRGDYALCHYDPVACSLTLFCAPMAMRLLYVHARREAVWFASTLAALHAFPGVPRSIDGEQVALQLTSQVIDPTSTVFKDIRLISPGSLAQFDAHGAQERVVWRPQPSRRIRLKRDEDYVEAARELLERAVRVRMRSSAPLAAMSTGGLDSSGVAATAARLMAPDRLRTYTAMPISGVPIQRRKNDFDSEEPGVRSVADLHSNIDPIFCPAGVEASFEADGLPLFAATGRPHITASHLGWFDATYRTIRRNGHAVVLTGQDGNLTLSFDGMRSFGDFARWGRLDLIAALLPAVARFRQMSAYEILKANAIIPFIPVRLRDRYLNRHSDRPAWHSLGAVRPELAKSVHLEQRLWDAGIDWGYHHEPDSRAMIARFIATRRNLTVENVVGNRTLYGFDMRDPLSDPDLVDFCLAIPRKQFLLGGRTRSLARRVLSDRLGSVSLDEYRNGAQHPEWHHRMGLQRAAFATDLERFAQIPLVADMIDLPRLQRLIDEWPSDAQSAAARRYEFGSLLPRAIHMGRYLRWISGDNR